MKYFFLASLFQCFFLLTANFLPLPHILVSTLYQLVLSLLFSPPSSISHPLHHFKDRIMAETFALRQIHEITDQQQTAINTIQATLVYHQTILDAQQHSISNIKATLADNASSINQIIHSLSEIATKLGFEITLPPLLPLSPASPKLFPVADATLTITSSPLDPTKLDAATPVLNSTPASPYVAGSSKTAATETDTLTRPPNLEGLFSSMEIKSATNQFDEAVHSTVGGFRKVCIGIIDGESMNVTIKKDSSISDEICPEVYFLETVPFQVLCAWQALYSTLFKEQEWTDAHNVFVEMNMLRCESKFFIFDPGGTLNVESISDLEDKVVFKGSVMIRLGLGRLQEVCTL